MRALWFYKSSSDTTPRAQPGHGSSHRPLSPVLGENEMPPNPPKWKKRNMSRLAGSIFVDDKCSDTNLASMRPKITYHSLMIKHSMCRFKLARGTCRSSRCTGCIIRYIGWAGVSEGIPGHGSSSSPSWSTLIESSSSKGVSGLGSSYGASGWRSVQNLGSFSGSCSSASSSSIAMTSACKCVSEADGEKKTVATCVQKKCSYRKVSLDLFCKLPPVVLHVEQL